MSTLAKVALFGGTLLIGVSAAQASGLLQSVLTPGVVQTETSAPETTRPASTRPVRQVRQSAPIWIAIEPGVLGRTTLNPAGIKAVNGRVEPVDNRPVFRTDSNRPGTDSKGTSFIVGHNFDDGSGTEVPFAALERVRVGHTVTVGTANGTLSYTVQEVFRVPKREISRRTDLLVNVPGRLILETCDTTPEGDDTFDNLVIITQLSGAQ
ncbi:class F sortase [Nocardia sp. NPDC057663]|uniref:class F sortase n=1 Tax=Nocardia sp. NPDC057663 TaxID=3346201 RepID=UPI003670DC61